MTENLTGDEALIRSLHVCDDGRDWTARLVWMMGIVSVLANMSILYRPHYHKS
ncbi:hypothetical protein KCF99_001822 [Salmonella enterica subsp. enterica serovar Bonariensis]|nr:hypothetical protein [Salmonella enterica subsp. enterica serovar Bonariensis]